LTAKAIDEAELGLRRKVDEISSLQVKLIDEQRSLELMRSTIPERDWHVREIYKLTEEVILVIYCSYAIGYMY